MSGIGGVFQVMTSLYIYWSCSWNVFTVLLFSFELSQILYVRTARHLRYVYITAEISVTIYHVSRSLFHNSCFQCQFFLTWLHRLVQYCVYILFYVNSSYHLPFTSISFEDRCSIIPVLELRAVWIWLDYVNFSQFSDLSIWNIGLYSIADGVFFSGPLLGFGTVNPCLHLYLGCIKRYSESDLI